MFRQPLRVVPHTGPTGQPPPVPLDGLLRRRRLEIARQVGEESRRRGPEWGVVFTRAARLAVDLKTLVLCCLSLVSSVLVLFFCSWEGGCSCRSGVRRPTQELRVPPRVGMQDVVASRLHCNGRVGCPSQRAFFASCARTGTDGTGVQPHHHHHWGWPCPPKQVVPHSSSMICGGCFHAAVGLSRRLACMARGGAPEPRSRKARVSRIVELCGFDIPPRLLEPNQGCREAGVDGGGGSLLRQRDRGGSRVGAPPRIRVPVRRAPRPPSLSLADHPTDQQSSSNR